MGHGRWMVPVWVLGAVFALALGGCREHGNGTRVLGRFPLDDLDGLLTTRNVDLDTTTSSDGHGSLHFFAPGERVVNLYQVETPGLRGPCNLVWSLHVRTVMLINPLDVEVWLFPRHGDPRMVREHLFKIHQTVGWTGREVRIPIAAGEKIEKVRLAVHTSDMGHVWLDDMELRREPSDAS